MVGMALLIQQCTHGSTCCGTTATDYCYMITVQLQSKMRLEWMVGMALLVEQCMQCSSALLYLLRSADYFVITVQPQTKMYSWTEWLAWLC
jgi:hypothetical protein